MTRPFIFAGLVLTALLTQCTTTQKVTYEFPAAMAEPIRMEYTKQCDKGKALYDINCAKCHTRHVGRREIIPDFNDTQREAYAIRVANAKHEANLTETKLTAEELGLILTFLSYKKKNDK